MSAKVKDIRRTGAQRTNELREAAQGKAQELGAAVETVWADARSQAKDWQAKGEAYTRDYPTKAVLMR